MANAPIHSPLESLGRYARFCSSVPCSQIGTAPMQMCAPSDNSKPESRPPSSNPSSAMQVVTMSAPWPPYSSGIGRPAKPNSPTARHTSGSQRPSRSRASASGRTTFSAKSRTEARKASCSSVNAKLSATRGLPAGETAKECLNAARFDETRHNDEGEEAGRDDHHGEKPKENVRYHRATLLRGCERAQRTMRR